MINPDFQNQVLSWASRQKCIVSRFYWTDDEWAKEVKAIVHLFHENNKDKGFYKVITLVGGKLTVKDPTLDPESPEKERPIEFRRVWVYGEPDGHYEWEVVKDEKKVACLQAEDHSWGAALLKSLGFNIIYTEVVVRVLEFPNHEDSDTLSIESRLE